MNTQLKSANNVVALVHSNLSEAFGDNITKPFKDKEDSGEFNILEGQRFTNSITWGMDSILMVSF